MDFTTFQCFPCRGYGVEVVEVSVFLHVYAELELVWTLNVCGETFNSALQWA